MHKFHCLKSLQIVKYVKQSLLDGHIPSSVLEKLKRSKEEVKDFLIKDKIRDLLQCNYNV